MIYFLLLAACASLLLSAALVFGRSESSYFSGSHDDLRSVQASHTTPTPRTGGLAIMLGLVVGVAVAAFVGGVEGSVIGTAALVLVAAIPVFVAGVVEDTFRHIPTSLRYLAAVASAILAIVLFGVWIGEANLGPLDSVVRYAPVGLVLTVFLVASYAHAFNLIDGLNGLAGGVALIAALSLVAIGTKANVPEVVFLGALVAAATLGFLAFNFPFGKIFLGDSGAYVLGFILTWGVVLLLDRAPSASGWSLLLVFFWPMADTVFAMYRRVSGGRRIDSPDRLHFHQLVMRALEIFVIGRNRRHLANPLAAAITLPMIAGPAIAGVLLWDDGRASAAALLAFALLFVLTYQVGIKCARRRNMLSRFSRSLRASAGAEESSASTVLEQSAEV